MSKTLLPIPILPLIAGAGLLLSLSPAIIVREAFGQETKAPRPAPATAPASAPAPGAATAPPSFPDQEEPLKPPPDDVKTEINPSEFELTLDQSIKMLEKQVAQNPKNFILLTSLGRLYESKAAEGGDLSYYAKAEETFRAALKDAPKYLPAKIALAGALCDRHKFAESLEVTEEILKDSPKNRDALMIKGDCVLELGEFEKAERTYKHLAQVFKAPNVNARLARIAELKGDSDKARKLMTEAAIQASKFEDPETSSWYVLRLGDMALAHGQLDEAAQHYESILKSLPDYHDALFNLGRARAAQGRFEDALGLVRKAVQIGAEPHMLSYLSDLLVKMGKIGEAETIRKRILDECAKQPEYRREVAMFLCDHDLQLPMALELASADFETRKDIAARDVLAWALFKNGKAEEAAEQMKEAVKLGTKDARMFYHGALILEKLGYKERAREYLDKALDLNPYFSLLHAESAKALRDSLPKRGG